MKPYGFAFCSLLLLAAVALGQDQPDTLLFPDPNTNPPNQQWGKDVTRRVKICRPPCTLKTNTPASTSTSTTTPTATATPTVTSTFTNTPTAVFEFGVINAPLGTDPVADTFADTLNITVSADTPLLITGDSATDTLNFDWDFSVANTWTGEQTFDAGWSLNDNDEGTLGTGNDAVIEYDATDLIIDPRRVGVGKLLVGSEIELLNGGVTYDGTPTVATGIVFVGDAITVDEAGRELNFFALSSTVTWEQNSSVARGALALHNNMIFTNPAGEVRTHGIHFNIRDNASIIAATTANLMLGYESINMGANFSTSGGGTLTLIGDVLGNSCVGTYGAGVTANRVCFRAATHTGAGTVNTSTGISIEALTATLASIGLSNADTTMYPSPAVQNVAAGTAITVDGTKIKLTATGATVMTAVPTIATPASSREQYVCLTNVDTADAITLQDQGTLAGSNLRLSGVTVVLGPRDTLCLNYDPTVGDWIEWDLTNVV
jgi:hypothetical protein